MGGLEPRSDADDGRGPAQLDIWLAAHAAAGAEKVDAKTEDLAAGVFEDRREDAGALSTGRMQSLLDQWAMEVLPQLVDHISGHGVAVICIFARFAIRSLH